MKKITVKEICDVVPLQWHRFQTMLLEQNLTVEQFKDKIQGDIFDNGYMPMVRAYKEKTGNDLMLFYMYNADLYVRECL